MRLSCVIYFEKLHYISFSDRKKGKKHDGGDYLWFMHERDLQVKNSVTNDVLMRIDLEKWHHTSFVWYFCQQVNKY